MSSMLPGPARVDLSRLRVIAALAFLVVGTGFWLGPSWMIDHAVSDLGVGSSGWLMSATFVACGIVLGGPAYLFVLLAFVPGDRLPLAHFAIAWTMFGLMGGSIVRRLGLAEAVLGVVLLLFTAIGSGSVIGLAERAFFVLWLVAALAGPRFVSSRGSEVDALKSGRPEVTRPQEPARAR